MKKNLLLLTAAICLIWNVACAQTKLTEGIIKYKIEVESDQEQVKQMFNNSDLTLYVKNKKKAILMSMGAYMKMNIISYDADKKVVMLMDAMGQKKQINMTDKEYKDYKKKMKKDYKVEYVDGTKTIAGYTCKKAIITTDDGAKLQIWYTEDLDVEKTSFGGEYDKIKGFLMEYQLAQNGTVMTFTVSDVQKGGVDDKMFDIPAGYDIMSYDDMLKSQGATH